MSYYFIREATKMLNENYYLVSKGPLNIFSQDMHYELFICEALSAWLTCLFI